mgnify:CR=1 FL=1|tara:strand:- start:131 stop:424 length:294 start_codon:yes stop_codon:yes gene_type:complete
MQFKPFNRHIVVNLIEDEQEEDKSLIVLPTEYKKPESAYAKAIVVEVAEDAKLHEKLSADDVVLVERRMLHKIEIKECTFYLVLENYIYGRINDEIN